MLEDDCDGYDENEVIDDCVLAERSRLDDVRCHFGNAGDWTLDGRDNIVGKR